MNIELWTAGRKTAGLQNCNADVVMGKNGDGVSIMIEDDLAASHSFGIHLTADEARALAAALNRETDNFAMPHGVGVR